jgi:SAM-dependent methyltransferase
VLPALITVDTHKRYNEHGFAFGTGPNEYLKNEYSQIPKGGRVLCLAEGEGRNAFFLAPQGYLVTAIDQSPVGLNKANKLASKHGVTISIIVIDLDDCDFGIEAWDGIVSISAHVPALLRKNIHSKIVHALKDNGVFILAAYTER